MVDAATGKPVAGMTIACGAILSDSGKRTGASAVTDESGRYRLPVPSGIYVVWLEKFDKGPSRMAAKDEVLVEAGKVTASQLQLSPGREVKGKVVGAKGKPFATAWAKFYSAASIGPQDLTINEDGSFEFAVPPGRVQIYAGGQGGSDLAAESHFRILASGDIAPITLDLKKPARTPTPQHGSARPRLELKLFTTTRLPT